MNPQSIFDALEPQTWSDGTPRPKDRKGSVTLHELLHLVSHRQINEIKAITMDFGYLDVPRSKAQKSIQEKIERWAPIVYANAVKKPDWPEGKKPEASCRIWMSYDDSGKYRRFQLMIQDIRVWVDAHHYYAVY